MRIKDIANRFFRDIRGVAAIEFAMIAGPFLFLLMAIFEVSIIFFTGLVLEHGVIETSRLVRTGQLQAQGGGEDEFREELCSNMLALVDCDEDLHFDVRVFSDFGSTDFSDPDETETFGEKFGYESAGASTVVLVRFFYLKDIFTPGLRVFLANHGSDQRVISWSAAFETEPF